MYIRRAIMVHDPLFGSVDLKRRILDQLDNQMTFISIETLAESIDGVSVNAVKKACEELKLFIKKQFKPTEATFLISRSKGVLYNRRTVNNRAVSTKLLNENIFYNIIRELFLKRSVSTTSICLKHHISESQLRREINKRSPFLHDCNLHISVGSRITIKGPETAIRTSGFTYLFFIHRSILNVSWVTDPEYYIRLSKDIIRYLGVETTDNIIQIVSLICYVTQISVLDKRKLVLDEKHISYFKEFNLPKVPSFLPSWSQNDWEFMLLTLYAVNLFRFDIPIDISDFKQKITTQPLEDWMALYEKTFCPLTRDQITYVEDIYYKDMILFKVVQINPKIMIIINYVDIDRLKNQYPYFYNKTIKLWQEFITLHKSKNNEYVFLQSLLLSLYFTPIEKLLPHINVFLFTDYPVVISRFMQNRLTFYFARSYQLFFKTTIDEADIVIGTSDISTALRENGKLNGLPFVIINRLISERDLYLVEKQLTSIVESKLYE